MHPTYLHYGFQHLCFIYTSIFKQWLCRNNNWSGKSLPSPSKINAYCPSQIFDWISSYFLLHRLWLDKNSDIQHTQHSDSNVLTSTWMKGRRKIPIHSNDDAVNHKIITFLQVVTYHKGWWIVRERQGHATTQFKVSLICDYILNTMPIIFIFIFKILFHK